MTHFASDRASGGPELTPECLNNPARDRVESDGAAEHGAYTACCIAAHYAWLSLEVIRMLRM